MGAVARRRPILAAALVAVAATLATVALPGTASAIDTGPRAFYVSSVSSSGVQVNGTFTPVVGNFAGGFADDILWYAPGTAADSLWTTIGKGTFTRQSRTINGTYLPLVGDFAGDDFDDILWYAPGPAADVLWTSVTGPQVFASSPIRIDGRYQPVVLDRSLDLAAAIGHATGPFPNDTIVWYRPGAGTQPVWNWNTDGTHTNESMSIEGSPQLIPFNVDTDTSEDLLAYTPGPGPDAIYTTNSEGFTKTAKTVNGTYRPTILGNGYRDAILWYGPGTATDAYWSNNPCCGLASTPTQPIGGTSVWPADAFGRTNGGSAYVYDSAGTDRGFVDGYSLVSTDGDIGAGALPFTGDFDDDLGIDTFFYRPGAATDVLRFGSTPVVI